MIAFAFAMLGTLAVADVILHVWDGAGGIAGARARDADRRRRRNCPTHRRVRRHG